MKFLVDAQLPARLARLLQEAGEVLFNIICLNSRENQTPFGIWLSGDSH